MAAVKGKDGSMLVDYNAVVQKFSVEKKKFVDTIKAEWKTASDEWDGERKRLERQVAKLEKELQEELEGKIDLEEQLQRERNSAGAVGKRLSDEATEKSKNEREELRLAHKEVKILQSEKEDLELQLKQKVE